MIRTTKDGRTIRKGQHYTQFRRELYVHQLGLCAECRRYTYLDVPLEWDTAFHTDHEAGRGMGGGKRDDTFEACKGKCGRCHRKKHNQ